MTRGDLYWADLGFPVGSSPGFRRPVLVIQSDRFNASLISTVVVSILTSNLALAEAPGNVLISKSRSGLKRDSVCNVSQIATLDRSQLGEKIGHLDSMNLAAIDEGLKLSLGL
jgi:mRNA interferase MazF